MDALFFFCSFVISTIAAISGKNKSRKTPYRYTYRANGGTGVRAPRGYGY